LGGINVSGAADMGYGEYRNVYEPSPPEVNDCFFLDPALFNPAEFCIIIHETASF